jgi:hypothetical protein
MISSPASKSSAPCPTLIPARSPDYQQTFLYATRLTRTFTIDGLVGILQFLLLPSQLLLPLLGPLGQLLGPVLSTEFVVFVRSTKRLALEFGI